jgi:acyl-CoA synthetase (AMP-forming)/AMP-acid ligase II
MNKERSLGEIFSEIAQANSNRPALIFPDRTFTFDQLSKMVQSFALKFREAGCGESLSVQLLASDQLIQLAGVIASSVIGGDCSRPNSAGKWPGDQMICRQS